MVLVRVVLVFTATYAALQALVWFMGSMGWLEPTLAYTASLTGWCSRLTGVPAVVSGTEVALATRILRIDPQCTAVSLAMLYAALVVAYPLGLRQKLVALGVGLPVLFAANLGRLTAVAHLSGLLDDDGFMFVHDYLFMIAMMAVVIGLWVFFLAWARRRVSAR
jgi:exosortase/archaeosortase family protein